MQIELLMVLLTIIGVFLVILANSWLTIKAVGGATTALRQDLTTLNESLGEMYSQIIEGGVGIEPVNPMQAIFAQILQSQLGKRDETPKVIARNDDGTFSDSS